MANREVGGEMGIVSMDELSDRIDELESINRQLRLAVSVPERVLAERAEKAEMRVKELESLADELGEALKMAFKWLDSGTGSIVAEKEIERVLEKWKARGKDGK
jgi:tetrahydromethanopterin S-methyltransferase subunit B